MTIDQRRTLQPRGNEMSDKRRAELRNRADAYCGASANKDKTLKSLITDYAYETEKAVIRRIVTKLKEVHMVKNVKNVTSCDLCSYITELEKEADGQD